jgi:hypothetical protein
VLASFRAVRPRVEPDPLNAKALRQRALVCCKGTLAAFWNCTAKPNNCLPLSIGLTLPVRIRTWGSRPTIERNFPARVPSSSSSCRTPKALLFRRSWSL